MYLSLNIDMSNPPTRSAPISEVWDNPVTKSGAVLLSELLKLVPSNLVPSFRAPQSIQNPSRTSSKPLGPPSTELHYNVSNTTPVNPSPGNILPSLRTSNLHSTLPSVRTCPHPHSHSCSISTDSSCATPPTPPDFWNPMVTSISFNTHPAPI
jgi:hypothetical protein